MFTMTNFASNILDMVFLSEMEGELIYIKALSSVTGYVPQIHLFRLQLIAFDIGWYYEYRLNSGNLIIKEIVEAITSLGCALNEYQWQFAFELGYRRHHK